jgi:hypothetical protein
MRNCHTSEKMRTSYIVEKENDNVYLNVVFDHYPEAVYNTNPAIAPTGEQPTIAKYTVDKTLPILDKASDYYVSVIRFAIPLASIPIFIMPIIPNQSNPNLTPLIIGINYNGVQTPVQVQFYSDENSTPPIQNQPTQVITFYYYIYTYQSLINMLNIALSTAFISSGMAAAFPGVSAPFFIYNPVTQLISLIVNSIFTEITSPATSLPVIFINESSLTYLGSFQYYHVGYNQPNGYDYIFVLSNLYPYNPSNPPPTQQVIPNASMLYPAAGPGYYIYTENYSTIEYWFSLRKIVLTSNTIPIPNEFVPGQFNNNVAAGMPILTDFVPALQYAGESRAIAFYNPSAQYRLIDLINDNPLYKIDISLLWQDVQGNLYPIEIPLYQQASVKLGFFRKTLYKQSKSLLK